MKTGVNTSTIIYIKKKKSKGRKNANCQMCKHFAFGYYCNKLKRSAEHYDKPKHCNYYESK